MEESNIQPVQSPVTVCGDIHGKESYLHFQSRKDKKKKEKLKDGYVFF